MPLLASKDLVLLLSRAAKGDREAFRAVYIATSAKLYGVVLRILRRRDLAEEVLQDVYVSIWKHAGTFDPERASPITWMVTIARNRALDEIRRKTIVSLAAEAEALAVPDPGVSAVERIEQDDDRRRLEACLERLEESRRELIKLAYLDGLSRQELADRFGHPVATIKTWLHRSLKILKECLGP